MTFSLQCVLLVHNNTTTICGKNDEEIGVHTLIGDTHIYVEIVPSHALLQSRINVNLMVFERLPPIYYAIRILTQTLWMRDEPIEITTWLLLCIIDPCIYENRMFFAQKSEMDEMRIIAIK